MRLSMQNLTLLLAVFALVISVATTVLILWPEKSPVKMYMIDCKEYEDGIRQKAESLKMKYDRQDWVERYQILAYCSETKT
jgi:hypothetical protein